MTRKLNLHFDHLDALFLAKPAAREIHLREVGGSLQSSLNIQQLYNWQSEKWATSEFMAHPVPFGPGGFMGLQPVSTIQNGWKVVVPNVSSFAIYGILLTEHAGDSPYVIDDATVISINPYARPHLTLFLCHSSSDKAFVRALKNRLAPIYDLFLDEVDIRPGESIPQKISEGLERADYLVFVVSKAALCSKWVCDEWAAMLQLCKPIVPVLLEDVNLPALLGHIKHIRFTGSYTDVVNELANATGSGGHT